MYNHFCSGFDFYPPPAAAKPLRPEFARTIENLLEYWIVENGADAKRLWIQDSFRKRLEEYLRRELDNEKLEVHLFGSSVNGFGLKKSDFDCCITLDGFSELPRFMDDRVALLEVAAALWKHPDYTDVVAITEAKVPIVRFEYKPLGLKGDISLYNTLALENSKLLRTYADIDPRVSQLSIIAKYFAMLCGIGNAGSGTLSSYAYSIMVIHYLQRCSPPILPFLQELKGLNGVRRYAVIDNCDVGFFKDLDHLHQVWPLKNQNRSTLLELWIGFLRYYTLEFNFTAEVVQIRESGDVPRQFGQKPVIILDPFDLSHNLGHAVTVDVFNYIWRCFRNALGLFGRDSIFKSLRKRVKGKLDDVKLVSDFYLEHLPLHEDVSNRLQCKRCGQIGHFLVGCSYSSTSLTEFDDPELVLAPQGLCSLKSFVEFVSNNPDAVALNRWKPSCGQGFTTVLQRSTIGFLVSDFRRNEVESPQMAPKNGTLVSGAGFASREDMSQNAGGEKKASKKKKILNKKGEGKKRGPKNNVAVKSHGAK